LRVLQYRDHPGDATHGRSTRAATSARRPQLDLHRAGGGDAARPRPHRGPGRLRP